MEVTLRAETGRQPGSRESRRIRRTGKIPAIVYGMGDAPIPVAVDARDLYRALHTEAGANAIINLAVEGGGTYTTLAREIRRHPWRGTIDHVDFVRVSLTETVVVDVMIGFEGTPVGVATDHGIVETIKNSVQVEALPTGIPPAIPIDISRLGIGEGVRVADLPEMAGVAYLDEPDMILAIVTLPAAEVALEEAAEEAPAEAEGEPTGEGPEGGTATG